MSLPRLEEWVLWRGKIIGRVFGHSSLSNGSMIITAPVEELSFKKKLALTCNGSVYTLGGVSEPSDEDYTNGM